MPIHLRSAVINISDIQGKKLNTILSNVLMEEESTHWGEPHVGNDNKGLIKNCEWWEVYDCIEGIYQETSDQNTFEESINDFFIKKGIGWKLQKGKIESRGSKNNDEIIQKAESALDKNNKKNAKTELQEAKKDISRRPEADITGAIQHAMAALECVAKDICNNTSDTLGAIIKKYPRLIPKPLDEAVSKMWGFTSNNARHIQEDNKELSYDEAKLTVVICSAIIEYLLNKNQENSINKNDADDEEKC